MNKKYNVEWATVAESDLKQIIDYIAAESPRNALHLFKKIRQKASSLHTFQSVAESFPNYKVKEYTSIEN
ncbi:MAG: type II toxin-antitoxin system RelE/ParE family toxin [Chromatiales bacterium]|nr:type II toxin-antitoxin system RelE/ParE family toxin [Chromatiales bacterium]